MMRLPVTSCAIVLLGACTHTREVQEDYGPRPVVELGRWQVQSDGRDLGFLILFEIRDPAGSVPFYRVVNPNDQWVGHVSPVGPHTNPLEGGRFSRRVPFRDEEQDLGIYPMARGLAELYRVSGDVQLTPVEGSASEASVLRVDRR